MYESGCSIEEIVSLRRDWISNVLLEKGLLNPLGTGPVGVPSPTVFAY